MSSVRDDIVFLFDGHAGRRDSCKSVLSDAGFIVVGFDSAAAFVDNTVSIRPKAVIIGDVEIEAFCRALHAFYCIERPPMVFSIGPTGSDSNLVDSHIWDRLVVPAKHLPTHELVQMIQNGEGGFCAAADPLPVLVGAGAAIQKVRMLVKQIHDTADNVCIRGEAGTGKELVARLLHLKSIRRKRPVIRVQCDWVAKAMSPNDLHGALAGGAGCGINGAGTIILKNLHELPVEYQAQLLRALEDIASLKSADVPRMVTTAAGANPEAPDFPIRSDLFYRLNVIEIELPPLRERLGDLGALFAYFADRKSIREGNWLKADMSFISKNFSGYPWPGNVAELEQLVSQWAASNWDPALFDGQIGMHVDPESLASVSEGGPSINEAIRALNRYTLREVCRPFTEMTEKRLMALALEKTSGNRKKAAELLHISYKSLLNKVKEYELA